MFCRNFSRILLNFAKNTQTKGIVKIVRRQTMTMEKIEYPYVFRDDQVSDNIHGVEIRDPYRWLEDPDSEQTKEFVDAQNGITKPFLETGEEWQLINQKLTNLWNYPKYGCPAKHGPRYFYGHNSGLQNQNVIYVQDGLDKEPKVFLDPNKLSEDGTIALQDTEFSDDGKFLAYALSESGSDWSKIKFRNVETNQDFPETLENVKFVSVSWTKDNNGVFYTRYPVEGNGKADGSETAANENQKLYYHRIGQSQDNDVLVAEFPEQPTWRFSVHVSDCGNYLLLSIMKGCKDSLLYFSDLRKYPEINGKFEWVKVVTEFEADYDYITNEGSVFSFRTNKNAPNYHIINIDFNKPSMENWDILVKEHPRNVLDWVQCVNGDKMTLCYLEDVKSVLQIHSLKTGSFEFKFPLDAGSISGFSGKKDCTEIFFIFVSFLTPGIIYHYDFKKPTEELTVFKEIKIQNFDQEQYKVDQIFYHSKDNEKIPMFIVHKKSNATVPKPCLLYGYGGFNISITPAFSITGLVFIDLFDGVLAYPNIRGGGEYGENWHNKGRLLNKQNVFDDFQAAGEYLIKNNYTTKSKLSIQGASNGGLLVGACINQRPDLFGAAIAQVGVLDMLRFHKFTIGSAWISDYGDINDIEHFKNLYKYSPLHNVKKPENEKEEYPATLVLTADHDDRVSPLHSLKFVANLQHVVKGSKYQKKPLFLRIYTKAGHGFGKPTAKKIEEATDILTFLYKTLDVDIKLC